MVLDAPLDAPMDKFSEWLKGRSFDQWQEQLIEMGFCNLTMS